MIRLHIPETPPKLSLIGTVKFLSTAMVSDPWVPLSGGFLPVLDNPVLFSVFGYSYGQRSVNNVLEFKLPDYNAGPGVDATFIRAWNSKNSSGRNVGRGVLSVVQGAIKSHSHGGGTSYDGNHSHQNMVGSELGPSSVRYYLAAHRSDQNPVSYGASTTTVSHSYHSHSAGNTSGTSIPAGHSSNVIEPKGYGALLCIHKG